MAPQTIRVIARSRSEVCLKLYMDQRVYTELLEHARPLCIAPIDLVRAVIAERFPNAPSAELLLGGSGQSDGLRAPKPLTDNREDRCREVWCGHSWGAHNADAQGNELPDGGPCIECALDGKVCRKFV